MIRTRRILFPMLCLMSILCALTTILWIRSYSGSDFISRNKPTKVEPHALTSQRHALTFTRGSIRLSSEEHTYFPHTTTIPVQSVDQPAHWGYGRLGVGHLHWDDAPARSLWNRLGFYSYETGFMTSFSDSSEKIIAFPAALPAILFAIPPVLLLRRLLKQHRRRRANLCPHCGYDIRATPVQCPECGQTIAVNHSAQTPSDQSDSPGSNPIY
jgi:hypothetical protein